MTADGHLVHVASSNTSTNYVLDLVEPINRGRYHDVKNISLMINRSSTRKSDTQTWEFTQVREIPYWSLGTSIDIIHNHNNPFGKKGVTQSMKILYSGTSFQASELWPPCYCSQKPRHRLIQ